FFAEHPEIADGIVRGDVRVEYYKVAQDIFPDSGAPADPASRVSQFDLSRTADNTLDQGSLRLAGHEPPITASEIPGSDFHGHGRPSAEPDVVAHAGADALASLTGHEPGEPVVVEVPGGGEIRLELGTHDFGDDPTAARSVPDGHGGYRIELSDRLADVNVER